MAWGILIAAGLLEVVWAYFLKQSQGFSLIGPSAVTVAAMLASIWLLAIAMKSLPLGTAYAVWTGIGALGTFVVGIAVLGDSASLPRIASAALIFTGLIGLRLAH